jgi:hypothetical protein
VPGASGQPHPTQESQQQPATHGHQQFSDEAARGHMQQDMLNEGHLQGQMDIQLQRPLQGKCTAFSLQFHLGWC